MTQAVVIGVPFDEFSSFMRGSAMAPQRIRESLRCGSSNMCVESGLDLAALDSWHDDGDLTIIDGETAFGEISTAVQKLLNQRQRVLALGGDHWITHPILHAFAKSYGELTVLHFDAHPDLYDQFGERPQSHACAFARVMEAGLASRLVQVGIRTMTPDQRQQAERFGVEVVTMRKWTPDYPFRFSGPLYISLDLDAFDPAFAPAVAHPEPGGFTTREVLTIIQGLSVPLVGADIVELNPQRDGQGTTAMLAAKLTKEILAKMLET